MFIKQCLNDDILYWAANVTVTIVCKNIKILNGLKQRNPGRNIYLWLMI